MIWIIYIYNLLQLNETLSELWVPSQLGSQAKSHPTKEPKYTENASMFMFFHLE